MRELIDHIQEADIFKPASARELQRRKAASSLSIPGPTVTVIYKGDRDHPDNYDNFTLNRVYQAMEDPSIEGFLILRNDLGEEVTMSDIDFDYVTQPAVPVREDIFKPASKKEVDVRKSDFRKMNAARRQEDTWRDRILEFQPEDVEPLLAMWFEDMEEEPAKRNKEFKYFVSNLKRVSNIDLSGLLTDYIFVPEKNRNETEFCDEAAERIAKAGLYVYNSDNYFEIYDVADMAEVPYESVREDVFKPASKRELARRRREGGTPVKGTWYEVFIQDQGTQTVATEHTKAEALQTKARLEQQNPDVKYGIDKWQMTAAGPEQIDEANVFKPASNAELNRRLAAAEPVYMVIDQEHRDTGGGIQDMFKTEAEAIAHAKTLVAQGMTGISVEDYSGGEDTDSETVWASGDVTEADIFKPASGEETAKRRAAYVAQLKAKRGGKTPYYIDLGSWIVQAKNEGEAEQVAFAKLADGERPAIDNVDPVDPDDGDYDDDYIETEEIPLKVQYPKEGPKAHEYYIDFTTWIILAGSESEAREHAEALMNMTQDERTAPSISQVALAESKVNEAKPKDIFKPATPEEVAKRREEYNKEQLRKAEQWVEIAKSELEAALEVETILEEDDEGEFITLKAVEGKGSNDESEWIVFADSGRAERYALERVQDDLENEPGAFGPDFLESHIYISDTDRRIMAGEESDNYVDDQLSDDDILEEANVKDEYDEVQNQIDELDPEAADYDAQTEALEAQKEKILDDAKDTVKETKYDEIYDALDDPIQYFVRDQGIYSVEDLMKANFISINYEEAAQDAIDSDGVAHFLDHYDGAEVELPSGAVAYGTN